jgi:hypothetical protein
MNLGEIGLGGVDWIRLAQDRDRWWAVVSAVMNLRVLAPWSYVTMELLHFPDHKMHFLPGKYCINFPCHLVRRCVNIFSLDLPSKILVRLMVWEIRQILLYEAWNPCDILPILQ